MSRRTGWEVDGRGQETQPTRRVRRGRAGILRPPQARRAQPPPHRTRDLSPAPARHRSVTTSAIDRALVIAASYDNDGISNSHAVETLQVFRQGLSSA